ncbi:DNA-methyltransferase [Methylobacterium brachiatum]|uniref:DNA-methyltransferase n=1 Tax=Methylobacterium brachiatum TaxID=269660 RepID=UPI0008F45179|nr:site-specific DNA-methyltransferase [Methylobacterium brachiatum]SFJ68226.1 DNA modification methylase [Methylobacterium brachiatum]
MPKAVDLTFHGYVADRVRLEPGDCRKVLRAMPDNSVDSVVTDPPYALVSIAKRFGKEGAAPAGFGSDGAYARAARGFMGQTWDTGETAFAAAFWADVLRVLKPGGHVVAFAGTRTYHRLAVAIEDAGFEIRDQLGWLYGSGFVKSHRVGEGLGTALKPAWEPIVLARKAVEGTVAGNVLTWGTGGLSVETCRIAAPDGVPMFRKRNEKSKNTFGDGLNGSNRTGAQAATRWPANVLHDGSDEVLAAFPGRESRFFYAAKAGAWDRAGSEHPTVKPVSLMRWLVRLVTPPGGLVLDPFAGSGTTGTAAYLEGRRCVLVEREAAYQRDIENRLAALCEAARPDWA